MFKNKLKKITLLGLMAFSLSACSNSLMLNKQKENKVEISDISGHSADHYSVHRKIMTNFKKWEGTKYKYGGTTKKGIDCSAFIGKIYKDGFNLNLPRTTTYLKYQGKKVSKKELKVGDMVFFRKNKHVGIYVGNNEFIHSSTKKGVIKTSLNHPYYSKQFTQGRRIL